MDRFVAIGDGGSGLPAQKEVAEQMLRTHDENPYDVVVLLGDNIYPNGDTIKYGKNRFTALYQPLLDRGVKFMALLGNHDISGPLGVGYPSLWMSNQKEHMRFFGMPASFYDFTLGDFHFFMVNSNKMNERQRLWLTDRMSRSELPWKIVCGHHPVYSSGFHGSSTYLKKRLKPIMEQTVASLYLSAHEHDYERFSPINEINYIVSGGGGADLRKFKKPLLGSLVRKSEHHFLHCQMKEGFLCVEAINPRGERIDEFRLHPREVYQQQRQTHLRQSETAARS